jgi:hypothetical protein
VIIMAIDNFEYTHPNGWEDSVNFPTTPANETQTRQLLQQQHKEVRDYIKTKLVPGVNAHLAENMPHQFINHKENKTYKFGFQVSVDGKPQIIYEEAI